MVNVTVGVPEERVADFYEFFGRWLGGRLPVEERSVDEAKSPPEPWSEADSALAQTVWALLSPRARVLFGLLADHPNERFDAEGLAEQLEIPHGRYGVAGTLAWPGRHCYAVERELPVKWQETNGGGLYWMTDVPAALFGTARDEEAAR